MNPQRTRAQRLGLARRVAAPERGVVDRGEQVQQVVLGGLALTCRAGQLERGEVDDTELARRRAAMEERGAAGWTPDRKRTVSKALQAYGMMTTTRRNCRGSSLMGVSER